PDQPTDGCGGDPAAARPCPRRSWRSSTDGADRVRESRPAALNDMEVPVSMLAQGDPTPGVTLDPLRRRAEIDHYDVLGRPPRPGLLASVELAARICEVPKAAITLHTATQQFHVATYGFPADVCRREDSMCAYVMQDPSPTIIADASVDERFLHHPFVTGVLG